MGNSYPWQDREKLKREYIDKDQTQRELADKWGCRQETISKWVGKHGLRKTDFRPWNDKETLEKLYHEKRMSTREIGDKFDITGVTVLESMEKFGIERRDRNKAQQMAMWSKPAPFELGSDGYERWKTTINRETISVYTHRLVAVAEYGFDAIIDREIHHKNGIKWDNRPENIEIKEPTEHRKTHAQETNGYIGKNKHLFDG